MLLPSVILVPAVLVVLPDFHGPALIILYVQGERIVLNFVPYRAEQWHRLERNLPISILFHCRLSYYDERTDSCVVIRNRFQA